MHEDLSRSQEIKASSNRAFGWTFTVAFLIIALWPIASSNAPHWWSLIVSGLTALVTMAIPALLDLPNRLWLRFGQLLHHITSPVALAIMFFLVITPIGLLLRAFGKEFLRLRPGDSVASYWIHRDPPGPEPASMSEQF